MKSVGFNVGKASPCVFRHKGKNVIAVVHGDDFTILGDEVNLDWFREQI